MRPQHIVIFIFTLLSCNLTFAGNVLKTKGKKVYIVFDKSEGGTFAKDDLFNITDKNGKKIGVVELKKIKGLKAIGVLRKGKAAKGNSTLFRSISKKSKKMKTLDDAADKTAKIDTDDEIDYKSPSTRFGLQFGYGSAKQDVVQLTSTASQSGSSMSAKMLVDMPLFGNFNLYVGFGAEMFSVSGTGQNANSGERDSSISTKITYLSIDTLMKWTLYKSGGFRGYLLGGGGLLHPLSKTSDSIDPTTITSLFVGEFGAGMEFKVAGYSLPVDFIYYYFPSGDTVETSMMAFRIGFYF